MLPISLKLSEECGSPENSFLKADFVHKAGLNESLDDALILFSLLNPVAGELVMIGANSRWSGMTYDVPIVVEMW